MATVLGPIGRLADHATTYAAAGLEIFPVSPADKTPLVSQHQATTDADQIAAWWDRWPAALIGHRIHAQHVLLDVDPRHGGLDTWRAIRAETGPLPTTRGHASGRGDGGGHTWWLRPADRLTIKPLNDWAKARGLGHDNKGKWSAGIDILHRDHRYTILPPSPHPDTGRPYEWMDGHGLHIPPAALPQLLVDLIVDDQPPAPKPAPGPVDPNSIADWYSTTYTWGDLLTRHGWQLVGGNGEGDGSRWRHPNASNAFSATIRHRCLFVYSPNTPFDVTEQSDPHGYTLFRAWATLEHAGNLSTAAKTAREAHGGPVSLRDDLSWAGANTSPTGAPSANGHSQQPGRRVALTSAASIAPKRVRWCWADRIAVGTIALLAGPEGLGKSTTAYWLASSLTRGNLPGEHHGTPKPALVCATEDSWAHTIVPRLMAADANLDLVYRIEVHDNDDTTDLGLSLPLDLAGLHHAATEIDPAILILDPLMSRLASNLDTHRDGEVRRALEPLAALADDTRLSILGLIHHNKSGSADPLQLVMASKAFTAVARSVHTVIRDPDDDTELRRLFGTSKNNLGRLDLPTLAFTIQPWRYDTDDGEGVTGQIVWGEEIRESIADVLLRSARDPEEKTAIDEACEWLEDYLDANDGRVNAGKTYTAGKASGHTERTLRRARQRLGIEKVKTGFEGGWEWVLPIRSKVATVPQERPVGQLASSGSTSASTGQIQPSGQQSVSPRARGQIEATQLGIGPSRGCTRCGQTATDISGLCPDCIANPTKENL